MARVLVGNEWYDEVSSTSLYEREFENVLLRHSEQLFPGFIAIPFKQIVSSSTGSARPDFALIDRDYRSWWVGEVEMVHHSWTHVITQVRVLLDAVYERDVADRLAAQSTQLHADRLREMLKGASPSVLVVANKPQPDWQQRLESMGARLAVFEIFLSDTNRQAFRFNGYRPTVAAELVSTCSIDRTIPRLVRIDSPAGIVSDADGDVITIFEGERYIWRRVDGHDSVWLAPKRRNPLRREYQYSIVKLTDGTLEIRLSQARGGRT